ncbi:uncharacterized protein K452DRAFT_91063 [Aplosporella prunicola CBS 121167]|uniref:Uncharacterized protein n=1 Tax=Aplosporella prunicola CBS 121167 TaxID=1176127 RepID=A0A6A6B5L1_9PEZI|nr:uncharacterized protein K452DRAFT_91063 [Aplosporella prunicola CBS 121167]KAF2138257.1 hypothetical protein K452DRAFT_91063 [Aplosporella prunicola CBS 121167]
MLSGAKTIAFCRFGHSVSSLHARLTRGRPPPRACKQQRPTQFFFPLLSAFCSVCCYLSFFFSAPRFPLTHIVIAT